MHAAGLKLQGCSRLLTFPKKGERLSEKTGGMENFEAPNKLKQRSLRSQLTTYSRDLMPVNYSPGEKYCNVRRLVVQSRQALSCDATPPEARFGFGPTSLRVWMSPDILNSAAQKIRAGRDPRLVTDSAAKPNVKSGHSPLCCSRMMPLNNSCEILTQHELRHRGALCPRNLSQPVRVFLLF